MVNFMELKFLGVPANIGLARLSVAMFASQLDFTLAEIEEIKVAVSEAVSNCIIHAYEQPGLVEVKAVILDNQSISIEIKDMGKGIADVQQARQPAYSSLPDRMGLGFSFMESFMDRVEVDSSPGAGTRVTMVKRCSRSEALDPRA